MNKNNLTPSPLASLGPRMVQNINIGHVPSPHQNGSFNKQFDEKNIIIEAGTGYTLSIAGDYIYLASAVIGGAGSLDNNPIFAEDQTGNRFRLGRVKTGIITPQPYTKLYIKNEGVLTATLILYVGYGRIQTDTPDTVGFPSMRFASGGLTRPNNATVYAANDIVTDTSGISTPIFLETDSPFERITLGSVVLTTDSPTTANTHFSLELYATDPGAIADNNPADFDATAQAAFIGEIDIPAFVTTAGGSTASRASVTGLSIPIIPTDAGFFFVRLVAKEAYVPTANQVITIKFSYSEGSN